MGDFSSLEDYKKEVVPIAGNTVNLFYAAEQNKDRPPKEFSAALTRKTTGEKGEKIAESLLVGPTYSRSIVGSFVRTWSRRKPGRSNNTTPAQEWHSAPSTTPFPIRSMHRTRTARSA